MEISFSVSNDTASFDRTAQGEKSTAAKTSARGSDVIPPTINTVTDLKLAESRGQDFSVSDEEKVRRIEQAIKAVQGKTTSLQISFHEKTHSIMVKVLDKDTGQVIREVPPEKTLDFVAKICEMAGLFVDEKR